MNKLCKRCNNSFLTYPSRKSIFCSHKCYSSFYKGKTHWWGYKMGQSMKGKKRSAEFCRKVKESHWSKKDPVAFSKFIKSIKHPIGKAHYLFKGRKKHSSGYIQIYINPGEYMLEHRYVMEKVLKRKLLPDEVVHHINGIKDDNRVKNLIVLKNRVKHNEFHERERNKKGQFS